MLHLPFCKCHHSRPLVLKDGLVRVHSDKQFIAKTPGLQHSTGMAMVSKVKATIYPNAVFADSHIFLRIYGPVPGSWDMLIEGEWRKEIGLI